MVSETKAIVNPSDKHEFVGQVVAQIGSLRPTVISQMVRLAATTDDWNRYTKVVRIWLEKRKKALGLE